MEIAVLYFLVFLMAAALVLIFRMESTLRKELRDHREESQKVALDNRGELSGGMKELKEELALSLKTISDQNRKAIEDFRENFDRNIQSLNNLQRERLDSIRQEQEKLIQSTEKKLEQMRETVDEKLQKTLDERLGQSFQTVGKQLLAVQEGLGEMKNLAQDVGGLKKVLSNVKMRGSFGELQLSMLLEQILAPSQYQANVRTKQGSSSTVEFAIKLPGQDRNGTLWMPIDAKFPKDVYEQLQTAYDQGDLAQVDAERKKLEIVIKKMAKDINEKYIDPPHTTDFALLFLPFEGLYAEVVKKSSLLEEIQRVHKIIVTGPTTLAAILNSLQMGFRTLAIQKRSGEVWRILVGVKKEFEKFEGLLSKAQNNLRTASNQLDDVMGVRTRAIQKKLNNIELLDEVKTPQLLVESDADTLVEETDPEN